MSSRRLQGTSGSPWWSGTPTTGAKDPFCDWQGVGCDSSCVSACDVTTLDMYENNLAGTIPTTIGNLAALVSLDLSGNQLGGGIPSEIANCQNLQILTADGNDFDPGTIAPAELCALPNLTEYSTDCNGDYFVICSCCSDCGDQEPPSESPSNVTSETPSVTPSETPSETPSVIPTAVPSASSSSSSSAPLTTV